MGGNDRIWDTPVKQDSDTVSIPKFSYKHPRHFYTGVPPGLTRDVGQIQPFGSRAQWGII